MAAIDSENDRALHLLRHEHELILNAAGEGIFGLDTQGRHTFVNPAAARMLGYEPGELLGKRSHPIWHHTRPDGAPYPEEQCPIYAAYREGSVHRGAGELFLHRNGSSFPVEYTSTPIELDGQVVGAVVVFRDMSEQKRMEEELLALSLTDGLTGLRNRRGFYLLAEQQMKMAVRLNESACIIYADLDHLKEINDTHGHKAGDTALEDAAGVLLRTFRSTDIIARFGGDEFVVFSLIDNDSEPRDVLLARLRQNLEQHNAEAQRPFQLSLSVGVAEGTTLTESIDELIVRADEAMYRSRQTARAAGGGPRRR
jgi:diguanylate cyclase (GGDEF)-like protein/PAS domain S-box-containing protein